MLFVALIDTGADLSFIPSSSLKNIKTKNTKMKAIAANGSGLEIHGEIINLAVEVRNHIIQLPKTLSVRRGLKQALIGADAISKNPVLLTEITGFSH